MTVHISQLAFDTDSVLVAAQIAEKALKIKKPYGTVRHQGKTIKVATITHWEKFGFEKGDNDD